MFTGLVREIGVLRSTTRAHGVRRLEIKAPKTAAGTGVGDSIAIDGISLTVAELGDRDFSVRIIPHTWAATNLRRRRSGDTVNLEGDVIGKYIARQRQVGSVRPVNMHDLEAAGFLDQDDA